MIRDGDTYVTIFSGLRVYGNKRFKVGKEQKRRYTLWSGVLFFLLVYVVLVDQPGPTFGGFGIHHHSGTSEFVGNPLRVRTTSNSW